MPNVDPVNLKFYLPSKIHKNINEINSEKMALPNCNSIFCKGSGGWSKT